MSYELLRSIPLQFTVPFLASVWVPILYFTIDSADLLTRLWHHGDVLWDKQSRSPENGTIYDFIIVGAGTSGSVLANRLSKHYNVLVLEAGGDPFPLQIIPGFGFYMINRDELDWRHKSTVQTKASLNSVNQRSSWSAGLGLGGTSTLNLFIHLRGHKKDYDNWARITKDPNWSWEGVLPFFKRYEDYQDDGDPKYHGFNGDVKISSPDHTGLGPEFIKAGVEMGYGHVDLNAAYDEGFDLTKYPIHNGARHATFWAFLKPVRRRASLTILKYAFVTRILIRDGNVAYGVKYNRHGETREVYCSKEVIISAGAIGTPKLLMLSGIGPRSHLESLGIPVFNDLPTPTKNLILDFINPLKDHLAVYLNPFFVNKPRTALITRDGGPSTFVQWFSAGKGLLSSSGSNAVGCIASSYAKARGEGDWPDLQLTFFGIAAFPKFASTMARAFGLKPDDMSRYYEHAVDRDSFMITISGARPYSRGYIRLGGKDPHDDLIIEPNYLGDGELDLDLKVLLEGVKTSLYLAENTTSLGKDLSAKFTDVHLPGCEHFPIRTDAYWECYIRRYTVTLHHPAGTATMGPKGASWAVTDSELKVQGINGLRVVDNSIQPVIIVTNTAAAAMMIGEKAADMIHRYWQIRTEEF